MARTRNRDEADPCRQRNVLAIRGTEEWKAWVDGLAARKRVPLTALIDQALAETAKGIGYPEPPPRY